MDETENQPDIKQRVEACYLLAFGIFADVLEQHGGLHPLALKIGYAAAALEDAVAILRQVSQGHDSPSPLVGEGAGGEGSQET